jgi:hypothetical protein
MSIQNALLQSYGFTHTIKQRADKTPPSAVCRKHGCRSHLLSDLGFMTLTMSFKEDIGLYFDAEGTMETFIDTSEICDMELDTDVTDTETIKLPYMMRFDWHKTLWQSAFWKTFSQAILSLRILRHSSRPKISRSCSGTQTAQMGCTVAQTLFNARWKTSSRLTHSFMLRSGCNPTTSPHLVYVPAAPCPQVADGRLLVLGDLLSITGVVIMISGTATFARTRIQRTMSISVT